MLDNTEMVAQLQRGNHPLQGILAVTMQGDFFLRLGIGKLNEKVKSEHG